MSKRKPWESPFGKPKEPDTGAAVRIIAERGRYTAYAGFWIIIDELFPEPPAQDTDTTMHRAVRHLMKRQDEEKRQVDMAERYGGVAW